MRFSNLNHFIIALLCVFYFNIFHKNLIIMSLQIVSYPEFFLTKSSSTAFSIPNCQKAFHVTFSNNIVVKKAPYFYDTQITQIYKHNIHIIYNVALQSYLTTSCSSIYLAVYHSSIYIRTVSSQLLLCSGTFVSFLANLEQKSSVLCMLLCPHSP